MGALMDREAQLLPLSMLLLVASSSEVNVWKRGSEASRGANVRLGYSNESSCWA